MYNECHVHEVMETLYENIRLYCIILNKCGQREVENWQVEDLDRAFHWADYFMKVVERLKKKRSAAEKVNTKLKEIGKEQEMTISGEELNFSSFAKSSEYLIQTLLQNPLLPAHLKERVVSRARPSVGDTCTDKETLQKKLPERSLPVVPESLGGEHHREQNLGDDDFGKSQVNRQCSAVDVKVPANTTSMLEYIEQLLCYKKPHDLAVRTTNVYDRLESFAQVNGGLAIILQSLIESSGSSTNAQQVILQWLLKKARTDYGRDASRTKQCTNNLWQESPLSLAKISALHLEFFKEHMRYLIREADQVEAMCLEPASLKELDRLCAANGARGKTEVLETDEEQSKLCLELDIDNRHTQMFDKLLAHFLQLLNTNEDVKKVCLSLVKDKALGHTQNGKLAHSTSIGSCVWFKLLYEITQSLL